MLGAKSEEAFRLRSQRGPRDQTRGRRQQVRDGECVRGTWTIPRWVDRRSCEDGHGARCPHATADKDLLPPQGQGLLRVPLGGSQRGDERKRPGEQHHEGGEQQPDGEECQRQGRDLGRQGRVTRKPLLWAPCMEVARDPAPGLLCPRGRLGVSLATCCPTILFRPDVTRGTAKEWGGGVPPGVAGTRPLTHTPQAALHPGLTRHEDTFAALSCHVWSWPEWTPRKPREFGWLCSPRWSQWEPSRECARTLGRQVVAPGRGGQAPQVTGTVQTRGGRGSDAHMGSSRAAKSGRVLSGQTAVSEMQ